MDEDSELTIEQRLDIEISLVENDNSLTQEQKENHVAALQREAKKKVTDNFREVYRTDKD